MHRWRNDDAYCDNAQPEELEPKDSSFVPPCFPGSCFTPQSIPFDLLRIGGRLSELEAIPGQKTWLYRTLLSLLGCE